MGLSRRAAADRPAPAPSPVPPAAPQDDAESPALTDDDRTARKAGLVRLMIAHLNRIEVALKDVEIGELPASAITDREPAGPAGLRTCPEFIVNPAGIHG